MFGYEIYAAISKGRPATKIFFYISKYQNIFDLAKGLSLQKERRKVQQKGESVNKISKSDGHAERPDANKLNIKYTLTILTITLR